MEKIPNKRPIFLGLSIIVVVLAIITLNLYRKTQLQAGIYEYGQIEDGNYSYVEVSNNSDFVFMRGLALNYLPMGEYVVDGNKLILQDTALGTCSFNIAKDKIIYEKSNFVPDLEKGSEFKFKGIRSEVAANIIE